MTPFDACYCKVTLPHDVSGSKLTCNVLCSAEKFFYASVSTGIVKLFRSEIIQVRTLQLYQLQITYCITVLLYIRLTIENLIGRERSINSQ